MELPLGNWSQFGSAQYLWSEDRISHLHLVWEENISILCATEPSGSIHNVCQVLTQYKSLKLMRFTPHLAVLSEHRQAAS